MLLGGDGSGRPPGGIRGFDGSDDFDFGDPIDDSDDAEEPGKNQVLNSQRTSEGVLESLEGTPATGTGEPSSSPDLTEAQRRLYDWWDSVKRARGKFPCYALPLILPKDNAFHDYLVQDGLELHQLSGKNCYVMILTDESLIEREVDSATKSEWAAVVENYVRIGIAAKLVDRFELTYEDYPVLVFFEDILSREVFILSLKGLDRDDIAELMRKAFTAIRAAVGSQENPIEALEKFHKRERRRLAGEKVVGELRVLGGSILKMLLDVAAKELGMALPW